SHAGPSMPGGWMTRFLSLEFIFLLPLMVVLVMLSSSGNLSLATVQTFILPALPKIPDISCGPSAGATYTVNAGADFQAALNAAKSGDTILLQPGVTYRGNFVLPPKTGTQCITIKPASMIALPPDGVRVNPAQHASA